MPAFRHSHHLFRRLTSCLGDSLLFTEASLDVGFKLNERHQTPPPFLDAADPLAT